MENKEISLSQEEMYDLATFLSNVRASKYILHDSTINIPDSTFGFIFVPVDTITGFIFFAKGIHFTGSELSKEQLMELIQIYRKIKSIGATAVLDNDYVMLFNCGA